MLILQTKFIFAIPKTKKNIPDIYIYSYTDGLIQPKPQKNLKPQKRTKEPVSNTRKMGPNSLSIMLILAEII